MESPPNTAAAPFRRGKDDRSRADVVRRLRRQVVTGTYAPPVDELVERLVVIICSERRTRWGS